MARGEANKSAKSKATGKAPAKNDIPDVYREMLADAVTSSPIQASDDGRPLKRLRMSGRIVTQVHDDPAFHHSDQGSKIGSDSDLDELFEDVKSVKQRIVQTESEDSADSDMEWEEVNLRKDVKQEGTPRHEIKESGELNLVLGQEGQGRESAGYGRPRRKPITLEEKRLRLEIHKIHVCSLMAHAYLRNHWCNDRKVHLALKSLLTKKTVSYLNPDASKSQFQRSRSFMDGLTQASEAFRLKFKITARGLSKPRWADSPEALAQMQPPEDIDLPMQLSDFRDAARSLRASRDVGAQIICALLRSAGVNARLVCSLLPLPFQPAQKINLQQARHGAPRGLENDRQNTPTEESGSDDRSDGPASAERNIGSSGGRTRFDAAGLESAGKLKRSTSPEAQPASVPLRRRKTPRKPIRESKYPVYWVEAFNEAVQKWVPIDPLVTRTIAKPSKFEPPAGEPENSMSYVVAFEDNGSARDVTRRYTKAYNAKTRRDRVEATNGGERWWRRVMKMYRRLHPLDRDQVENAELAAKEAAEPMPKNMQDFKDHPYYAIERYLKRHEAIHPKREVGKVGAGRAANINALEPIYRRRDVHMVKSADKWYRMGREIKPGEQPLKRVPARRTRDVSLDPEDQNADNTGTALYAAHQTTLYSAPPVKNGRVPKNVYGNLDVYASSMVPPGGTHIHHPETARAARTIGIDYADAVTGFTFKGRHGTAITNGAVVASEYREAVEEVIRAFDDEKARIEEEKRSAEALRMWKRLLAGLRIRDRIEGYDIEGERDARTREKMEGIDEDDDEDEGGGFLPDRDGEDLAQPTAGGVFSPQALPSGVDDKEDSNSQGDVLSTERQARDPFLTNTEDDDGDGFLINDGDADGEEAMRETSIQDFDDPKPRAIRETTPQAAAKPAQSQEPYDRGGGFIPDDIDTNEDPPQTDVPVGISSGDILHHKATPSPLESPENETSPEPAFSNLPDAELEEARMLQELYETGGMAQYLTSEQATSETPMNAAADDGHLSLHQDSISTSLPKSESMAEDSDALDSPESDKGSLLSEDPEDEDADPEWLA